MTWRGPGERRKRSHHSWQKNKVAITDHAIHKFKVVFITDHLSPISCKNAWKLPHYPTIFAHFGLDQIPVFIKLRKRHWIGRIFVVLEIQKKKKKGMSSSKFTTLAKIIVKTHWSVIGTARHPNGPTTKRYVLRDSKIEMKVNLLQESTGNFYL